MKTAIVASVSPTSFEALALSAEVERAFALASELGFDALELAVRDPALVSPDKILELADRHQIGIAAIGTGQAYLEEGLSLTSPDKEIRKRALKRMKDQLELGRTISAQVIVGLIRGGPKTKEEIQAARDRLEASLRELGEHAQKLSAPGLLLEPINRYETRLLNSIEQGIEFVDRLAGLPVKLLADTFHMNIEDRDPAASIRNAGQRIGHVHLADSNRWAPGQGHIDFPPLLQALTEIGYAGFLSAEILPEPSAEESVRLTAKFFQTLLRS